MPKKDINVSSSVLFTHLFLCVLACELRRRALGKILIADEYQHLYERNVKLLIHSSHCVTRINRSYFLRRFFLVLGPKLGGFSFFNNFFGFITWH